MYTCTIVSQQSFFFKILSTTISLMASISMDQSNASDVGGSVVNTNVELDNSVPHGYCSLIVQFHFKAIRNL